MRPLLGLGKEHHIEVESIVKILRMLSMCFQDVCWDQNVYDKKNENNRPHLFNLY